MFINQLEILQNLYVSDIILVFDKRFLTRGF